MPENPFTEKLPPSSVRWTPAGREDYKRSAAAQILAAMAGCPIDNRVSIDENMQRMTINAVTLAEYLCLALEVDKP